MADVEDAEVMTSIEEELPIKQWKLRGSIRHSKSGDIARYWINCLRDGCLDAIYALLLALPPNLAEIDWWASFRVEISKKLTMPVNVENNYIVLLFRWVAVSISTKNVTAILPQQDEGSSPQVSATFFAGCENLLYSTKTKIIELLSVNLEETSPATSIFIKHLATYLPQLRRLKYKSHDVLVSSYHVIKGGQKQEIQVDARKADEARTSELHKVKHARGG